MRAYSMDLRVGVLAALDAGDSTAEVAEAFTVSPAWVRRLAQRRRQTGEVAPRTATDTRVPKLQPHHPRIRELLAATPDLTLDELRDELRGAVALSTLWAAVRSLGYTFKKPRPANVTGSEPSSGVAFGASQEGSPCPRRRSRPSRPSPAT